MMGSVRGYVKFATRWLTVLALTEKGGKMTLTVHMYYREGGMKKMQTL